MPHLRHISNISKTASKLLVILMALLILNGSVDPADPITAVQWNGEDYVEDLSKNDIESIYELVTEQILDLEDFVPEHDNDAGDTDKNMKTVCDWLHYTYYPEASKPLLFILTPVYTSYTASFPKVFLSTDCPPPDAYC